MPGVATLHDASDQLSATQLPKQEVSVGCRERCAPNAPREWPAPRQAGCPPGARPRHCALAECEPALAHRVGASGPSPGLVARGFSSARPHARRAARWPRPADRDRPRPRPGRCVQRASWRRAWSKPKPKPTARRATLRAPQWRQWLVPRQTRTRRPASRRPMASARTRIAAFTATRTSSAGQSSTSPAAAPARPPAPGRAPRRHRAASR